MLTITVPMGAMLPCFVVIMVLSTIFFAACGFFFAFKGEAGVAKKEWKSLVVAFGASLCTGFLTYLFLYLPEPPLRDMVHKQLFGWISWLM